MGVKEYLVGATMCLSIVLSSCHSDNVFSDATAVWTLSDLNDDSGENSSLAEYGEVEFVKLEGADARASKMRGGDAVAARFAGGWLDAGQGAGGELNLSGNEISMLVRVKADTLDGYVPLLTKSGSDQNIAYSVAFSRTGEDAWIEAEIGSDDIAGAHLLKYRLPGPESRTWHDILFRFNGKKSELFVDGILRDDEVTVGELRDWNRRPVLLGALYMEPYGYSDPDEKHLQSRFVGLMDHAAVWNSYLSDDEVIKLSGVTELKNGKPLYYSEKYRPQFHFTARKNWINDPNGLVYYKGTYHLFFQYMPPCRPGAYKDWGHAVSKDLVHWEQTENHITPHKVWAGCWSGSAVVDVNNCAGFQTGDEKTIIAFLTNGGNPDEGLGPNCTQCIAYSTDGGNTFTYYDQNPVIRNIYNSNRDPKVVWDEDSQKWIMSLYMDRGNDFGLFASTDLKKWDYLTTVTLDGVAECPGFLPLPVDGNTKNKKWLFYGANGNYMIGSFDSRDFRPETGVVRADFGKNFYAAQTWSDVPGGRCIHIAWMPTSRYPGMPFEQQMNFPAELTLRKTDEGIRVFRMPVREISLLYDREFSWKDADIREGDNLLKDLNGDLYDIDMEIDTRNASSFDIGIRGASIHYDNEKKILTCGGPVVDDESLPPGVESKKERQAFLTENLGKAYLPTLKNILKLRILVDRTSIEIYGNDGRIVMTSCFMPDDDNLSYSFTCKQEIRALRVDVHSLKPAWDQK